MADLIEDPKKKKASFGDAAAAAADPGVMQIGGATRPAPMAAPAAPDIGPFVGKPGDFPVNPDGTPMMNPTAGAIPPALPSVARPPAPIGRTVQINSDGSPALTPDQKQAMANQTAAYVTGAQASAAARPPREHPHPHQPADDVAFVDAHRMHPQHPGGTAVPGDIRVHVDTRKAIGANVLDHDHAAVRCDLGIAQQRVRCTPHSETPSAAADGSHPPGRLHVHPGIHPG